MKILGRMWRIYRVSAIFFRTPCQRSSIAGQWNRGIMQSIRRLSLLRIYGDHSRTGCIRAAHIPRMHDAVGVCIAPLPRTFCVWFARRSHGDFFEHVQNFMVHVWRNYSAHEVPRCMWRIYCVFAFFSARHASAVGSPASETGALSRCVHT